MLKEHILIAGKIIDAAKAGDQAKVTQFNKEWFRNADEIVTFLLSANPNWNKQVLTNMFYTHLKLTSAEVEDRLKGIGLLTLKQQIQMRRILSIWVIF